MDDNKFNLNEQLLKDTLDSISKCHNTCRLVIPDEFIKIDEQKFKDTFESNINDLLSKIHKINNKIKCEKYNTKHIAGSAFRELDSDKDYFKIQSKAIEDSLIRQKQKIIHNVKCGSINREFVIFLNDTLFDISSFYQKLCMFQNIDISQTPTMLKRQKNHSREIFLSSFSLLRKERYINDMTSVPTCIFLIRQSIELRLFEIFGIEDIVDNNGNSLKITTDRFLDVKGIDDNIILPNNLTKNILKNIHKWTNYYIHRGYIWDYWLIEFAQYLLYDFILQELFICNSYYKEYPKLLSKKLSNKNNTLTESNIKRTNRNINICIIDNPNEFKEIKKQIRKKGYRKFYDEQLMKI